MGMQESEHQLNVNENFGFRVCAHWNFILASLLLLLLDFLQWRKITSFNFFSQSIEWMRKFQCRQQSKLQFQ